MTTPVAVGVAQQLEAAERPTPSQRKVLTLTPVPATLVKMSDGYHNAAADGTSNELNAGVVGSVIQTGALYNHVHRDVTQQPDAKPSQLPAAPDLVGRRAEFKALIGSITMRQGPPITLISGMGGVGKTALALKCAHAVIKDFPDGQLYLKLNGFTPDGAPTEPENAIRQALEAFGVAPERIQGMTEAGQISQYRSLLANRRVLVVLDDASNAEQVRPLIPGGPGCAVVITSRKQLPELVATDRALPIPLEEFSAHEARQLLVRRLGRTRVASEPQAVEDIIGFCGGLPLALSVVAARAECKPKASFTLAALVQDLIAAGSKLNAFAERDPYANIRSIFLCSYRSLSHDEARVFCLLALHLGPDIAVPAASSLVGIPSSRVRSVLAELARAHMINEHRPGRFSFHDLLRTYAHEKLDSGEFASESRLATSRLLDHQRHSARAAALRLYPHLSPIDLGAPRHGVVPEAFTDHRAALTWFDAERQALVGAVERSADNSSDVPAWQLLWGMEEFLIRRGYRSDQRSAAVTALSGTSKDDLLGQAHAHRGLGRAARWLGSYIAALDHFEKSLGFFEQLGDDTGQADLSGEISRIYELLRKPDKALVHAERSLALADRSGNPYRQARALNDIGWCHVRLGNFAVALEYCDRARALHAKLADRYGEGQTLHSLGYAHHHLGNHPEAIRRYEEALATHEGEMRNLYYEALTFTHLGDAYQADGRSEQARHLWEKAIEILHQLGDVVAGGGFDEVDLRQLHVRLDRLDDLDG